MSKKLLVVFILIAVLIFVSSCKKGEDISPIDLSTVDIEVVSNKDLLSILNDSSLKEGIYLLDTKSNKYIYFNGIYDNYININCKLENKTLIIDSKIKKTDKGSNKKLYLIKEKNITYSNEKDKLYDKIKIIVDGEESKFESIDISK